MAGDRSSLPISAQSVIEPRYFFWGASLILISTLFLLAPLGGISLARRIEAYSYDQRAKQFSPTSAEAARYQAIAKAIRNGQTDYHYLSNTGPGPGH